MGPEIYVDADACPVKAEVIKVAERHGCKTYLVSNQGMRPLRNPLVDQVVVSDAPDAADDWIAERIGANDIAITADILLASRCIERDALVLGPTGKPFTDDNIGMSLAMRDLSQHLRETGETSGSGKLFERKDRSRFLEALDRMVRDASGS